MGPLSVDSSSTRWVISKLWPVVGFVVKPGLWWVYTHNGFKLVKHHGSVESRYTGSNRSHHLRTVWRKQAHRQHEVHLGCIPLLRKMWYFLYVTDIYCTLYYSSKDAIQWLGLSQTPQKKRCQIVMTM